jgi:hypothetical protein
LVVCTDYEANRHERCAPEAALTPLQLDGIPEPRIVALLTGCRGGSKVFQSFLDDHPELVMVPGFPLMYLHPHFELWRRTLGEALTWERLIDLFCEKHASVLDSRRIPGASRLERLGDDARTHIEIDESAFRAALRAFLGDLPVSSRTFFLAIHYAYAHCKGWDLAQRPVLLFHVHNVDFVPPLKADFPDLRMIVMVRRPVAAMASEYRVIELGAGEQLNATDAILWSQRIYWLTCLGEYQSINRLGAMQTTEDTRGIRFEDMYADLGGLMRAVAAWLGIRFSDTMLISTFDGKKYWGDIGHPNPTHGLDPKAITDKWRKTISPVDQFVIEGLSWSRYQAYGYRRERYRDDGYWNRLLLTLAILVPARQEIQFLRRHLSLAHFRDFMSAARNEADGTVPRKTYTWSGTYLFKHCYIDLRLWEPRIQDKLLANGAKRLFVLWQALRYFAAILYLPKNYAKRLALSYRQMIRRLTGREFIPQTLAPAPIPHFSHDEAAV